MNAMKEEEIFKLENTDPEDISDVLVKVEKSFSIKFGRTELKGVKTFGELCDIIINKIELTESSDCTTQQAFYKLRNAISTVTFIDKTEINLQDELKTLFPKKTRRKKIKEVESELGFALDILEPKHFITGMLAFLFIVSLIGLFVSWKFSLAGIIVSLLGISIANRFGKELKVNSVSELAEKMSRESYLKSRRNIQTLNKVEVVSKIQQLFSHDLGLEVHELTREATFN